MELDQLRAFLAILRTGSFSQAAQDMYRTQPAISVKIRALENELKHRLLERHQNGATPTPAGEILRRRAETIFAEIDALSTELADLSARKTGRVSLGASDTVCLYLLPHVTRRFLLEYPGIELKLFTQISRRVLDLLDSNQIDIGIVTLPVTHEGIDTRELYEDNFVVVFPPGHPLEVKRTLRPNDLKSYAIVHLKSETFTRSWIDGKLEPLGLRGQVRMEVSTIEVIKKLVEVGMGISLLPEMAIGEEVHTGRLCARRLAGLQLRRPVGLAYRKEKYFSLALKAFVEELIAYTKTL